MSIALAFFLIIFSIFLHELGHALYMKKYKIPIETFSVGLPFPLKIKFTSQKIFEGATVQFTPFLLGAFVSPTKEGEELHKSLPYIHQADIYGAGPLANIIFSGILGILYVILDITDGTFESKAFWTLGIFAAFTFLLCVFRKIFMRYLTVPIGLMLAVFVVWSMLGAPTESVGGPVSITQEVTKVAINIPQAIRIAMLLSLSIGLFNLLPLVPLDGGKILNTVVGKYLGKTVQKIHLIGTSIIFVCLVGIAILSDFF
jgi:membrane-associated protease RseP (regulator of RpoE activity)